MSDNPSAGVYLIETNSILSELCKRSASWLRNITEIVEKLKDGNDINAADNSSLACTRLAEKLKAILTDSNAELNVSREDIQTCLKNFPWIYNVPIQIYFITICKAVLMTQTTNNIPEEAQLREVITDIIRLQNNGLVANVYMYLECFIDAIVVKIKKDIPLMYKLELCNLLVVLGSTARTGAMIISKLRIIFDSYFVYMNGDPNWKGIKAEEDEVLMMLLNTITEILQYNSSSKTMGKFQDFTKLNACLHRYKQLTRNRILLADIAHCLGLWPA